MLTNNFCGMRNALQEFERVIGSRKRDVVAYSAINQLQRRHVYG